MDNDIPKCPRCLGGGHVTLISEGEDKTGVLTDPWRKRASQVFQCTCGWTLMRTKPPRETRNRPSGAG